MGFARKTIYGYKEMWDKITTKISTITEEIKTWCNGRFSLITHNHDTKYDSKGSALTVQTNLNTHDGNTTKHITASERTTWNSKASGSHTHTTSQISGLDTALAGKASTNHTHTASSLGVIGFPDYNNASSISIPYTATKNGWIQAEGYRYGTGYVCINGIKIMHFGANFSEEYDGAAAIAPISIGNKVTTSGFVTVRFIPIK